MPGSCELRIKLNGLTVTVQRLFGLVQAGMDVVEIRREYGHDLAMAGGISKRAVARGGEDMRRAVDRVMPLVEDGGYLPELDHSAPPDISWQNFGEFMSYLMHRLGRG